ncbi:MAG: hypothetical protein JEY94_16020 [Melioribacteraceae bacterium]|nr:hypothetical protein [Melioribacteraceae bacterium]
MKITQKHLFNYVYYPGSLYEKEYLFIKKNIKLFEGKIEFLRESKQIENALLDEKDENEILQKVLKKISGK